MTKMEKLQNKLDWVEECNKNLNDNLSIANRICVKLKQGKSLTEKEVEYLGKLEDYYNSRPSFEQR